METDNFNVRKNALTHFVRKVHLEILNDEKLDESSQNKYSKGKTITYTWFLAILLLQFCTLFIKLFALIFFINLYFFVLCCPSFVGTSSRASRQQKVILYELAKTTVSFMILYNKYDMFII